jgi:steroid 5-alpha reductase family enzyme
MKIINTAIILGLTLLAVPIFTWFSGVALGEEEWAVLRTLVYVLAGVVLFTFLVGELTSNNSQVDKLWSIIPIVYVWIIAHYGDYAPRLMVMLVLVALWGGRLTTNFALKGAYSWKFWDGEEDYRWVVLRNKPEFQPRWKWTLFNLFFISGYQNVLILLFTLPALVVFQFRDAPLGVADYAVAGAMFFFIAFETLADWQQWTFQSAKWAKIKSGQPLNPDEQAGFLQKGLWARSRHPNYFAEQAIWVCFYFFTVSGGAHWFNWSVVGCILLLLLFQGSSNFSEEISASKYPAYKDYQARVPRFIPRLF